MKNTNKFIIALFLTVGIFSCTEQEKLKNTEFDFELIYTIGLQGDMNAILELLDSIPDKNLTDKQISLKDKYYKRFRERNEEYTYKTNDTLIIDVVEIFHDYWNKVLVDNNAIENENTKLENKFVDLLYENNYISSEFPRDSVYENLSDYLMDLITQKGFYSNAMGKTQGIYDLFLWASTNKQIYDIKLPEKNIKVQVDFMENFVSNGWADYATFGRYYASGWATQDALYCVKKAYDISSESFDVSYLKHEAQHFADYKTFPLLEQTDLEYRAKLTELSTAQETIYKLISVFIKRSEKNKELAHPFAQYCIICDLSKRIFNKEFVSDMNKWEKVPYQKINKVSIELIKQNTADLNNIGAETVTKLIQRMNYNCTGKEN